MDQQQQPPSLRRRFSPPPLLHLPMCWTPTDQVIMEDLLLSHDAPASLAAAQTQWGKRSRSVSSTSSSSSSPLSVTAKSTSASASAAAATSTATAAAVGGSRQQMRRAPSSRVSDEERRARHRAVQKRFVQRKKEAIKQTKQLAADLERRYAVLQITSEQKALERENAELQAQCDVAASANESASAPAAVARDPLVLMREQMELVREFYEPLSHDAWTAMLRKNLDEYELASLDRSYLSSGLTIMGWHDQRKIDDSTVKFVLSKEFPNVSAPELLEKTWRQLSSPETHAQFFSPVFTVRVQVLQVMNENARVIHRALYNPQTGLFAHGLDLLCRVQHGRDFIIFESAVEHNAVHACLGASHKWSKITVSQVFSPLPPSPSGVHGCIFRHGGLLRDFVVSTVKYWLMEMFFIALRYESAMVAPIFSITSE